MSGAGTPGESDTEFLSSGLYYDDTPVSDDIAGGDAVAGTLPGVLSEVAELPIGVKFPLEEGTGRSGIFQMEFDANKALVQSFKNYLNTDFGERLCNPGYGANLGGLVSEYQNLGDQFESMAMSRIQGGLVEAGLSVIQLETFTSQLVQDDDPAMLRLNMAIKFSANNALVNLSGQVVNVSFYII